MTMTITFSRFARAHNLVLGKSRSRPRLRILSSLMVKTIIHGKSKVRE